MPPASYVLLDRWAGDFLARFSAILDLTVQGARSCTRHGDERFIPDRWTSAYQRMRHSVAFHASLYL